MARIVWLSVALWRSRDLRPVAVVDADPLLARGVGQQAAAGADDDHAAAHLLRGAARDVSEALASGELVLDARGHERGLAERLRLDLGVDAVAQADDERDLEGDDCEHQHVGERQQQAEAKAYESSSGAVNRKPTPRTVCR